MNCWDEPGRYFVRIVEGGEPHFKMSVRAFDDGAEFKPVEGGFEIISRIDEVDLVHLTSVKNMLKLPYN